MRVVRDADLIDKSVLLRVDFNVPLANGTVVDASRIEAALPTLKYTIKRANRVIILCHFGRPDGTGFEAQYSLRPVARVLKRILDQNVELVRMDELDNMPAEGVILLENLRFDAREKANSPELAAELAALGDIYINDAFGAAHRAHTSIDALARLLPSYAGFLLEGEVDTLSKLISKPERPFVAVLGGAKVSDKLKVINALLNHVDDLIIGGGMCFTFLYALGHEVGASIVEKDFKDKALELLDKAKANNVQVHLPSDIVGAERLEALAEPATYQANAIPADIAGLDIGPDTTARFESIIKAAKTVFWNGPMGAFEYLPFSYGTRKIAEAVAYNRNAFTVIGGGDSASALKKTGLDGEVDFISTGGGAALCLFEGKVLPAVLALEANSAK